MPSSLTRVLPRAFVFSTRPPVSVSGTGTELASLEAFLGSVTYGTSVLYFPPHHSSRFPGCAFYYIPRSLLGRPLPSGRFPHPPASPLRSIALGGTGISTCSPSTTPFGLALGPDLPWADEPSPGTLGLSADKILTCLFATHTGILTSIRSTSPSSSASPQMERSPTMFPSIASVSGLAPLHFPRSATRPVSYYALFQWWLLLSQHPGCLCNATSFPTEPVLWDLSCWSGLFPF